MKARRRKQRTMYISPMIKVVKIEVEKGFALSKQPILKTFQVNRMYNGGDVKM